MGKWREERASRHIVPRKTRHVWINFGDLDPMQGLILDWRRHAYKWSALVVFVDENYDPSAVVQQWIPAEMLKPVPADRVDMPRKNGRPQLH